MSELQVDLAELQLLGRQFVDLASLAGQSAAKVTAAMDGVGACWGNDEPGHQFAKAFVPDSNKISTLDHQLAAELQLFGENLAAVAEQLAAQDEAAGAQFQQAAGPNAEATSPITVPPATTLPAQGTGTASPASGNDPGPANGSGPSENPVPNQPIPSQQTPDPTSSIPQSESPLDPPNDRQSNNEVSSALPPNGAGPAPTGRRVTASGAPGRRATPPNSPDTPTTAGPKPSSPDQKPSATTGPNRVTAPDGDPPPRPWRTGPEQQPKTASREPSESRGGAAKKPLSESLSRHGIQVAGFDLPGADESALAEIAAAIDAVLERYPFVVLRRVTVAELPTGEWSQVLWHRDRGRRPVSAEMTVAAAVVLEPKRFAEQVTDAADEGYVTPASRARPVYSTVIRAMGQVVDVTGGFAAREVAHRALVATYLARLTTPRPSLGRVVRGFRQWRNRLWQCCFYGKQFHAGPALAEAFMAVEMAGQTISDPEVADPALVLHNALLVAARKQAVGQTPPVS